MGSKTNTLSKSKDYQSFGGVLTESGNYTRRDPEHRAFVTILSCYFIRQCTGLQARLILCRRDYSDVERLGNGCRGHHRKN
ncbi:hypothetical protein PISMIDRAFT_345473 [Pisolithus microcarpus 441]|uniref:Uncharacterized protein n=1 Tax=Pisolithus microcarpus 441 TaxID=765257 RepID=A0A0C9YDE7_9AGAM|nr:hypothetical protein PISMIDRAFT_345473 [Pisolithus microcarpus 441]